MRKTLVHKRFKRDQPRSRMINVLVIESEINEVDTCARDAWVSVQARSTTHLHKLLSLSLSLSHSRFIYLFIFAYRLRLYMLRPGILPTLYTLRGKGSTFCAKYKRLYYIWGKLTTLYIVNNRASISRIFYHIALFSVDICSCKLQKLRFIAFLCAYVTNILILSYFYRDFYSNIKYKKWFNIFSKNQYFVI